MLGHQTLHGYREGHRLLATSVSLPSKTDQIMLVLSDLSGSAVPTGFRDYLTGYPLSDFGFFVLAMTWYADEMPRPGCVWTHSILISFSDVANIRDPAPLIAGFRRPRDCGASTEGYRDEIRIHLGDTENRSGNIADGWTANALLQSLYCNPDAPAILPARTSHEFGPLLLELWTQQWPRLRRTFTFCTGSLASRTLLGRPFDLQICPEGRVSALQSEIKNATIVSSETELERKEWFASATRDLCSSSRPLRSFLFEFGADISSNRSDFIPLVEIYDSIRDHSEARIEFDELVSGVVKRYPGTDEARKLKTDLLSPRNAAGRWLKRPVSPSEVVNAVYRSSPKRLLSHITDPRGLALDIWRGEPMEAIAIVDRILQGEYKPAEPFLEAFTNTASIEDIAEVGEASLDVVVGLATRNPRLAAARPVWLASPRSQEALVDSLANRLELNKSEYRAVVEAMHASRTWSSLTAICNIDIRRAVEAFLAVLNTVSLRGDEVDWQNARKVLDGHSAEIKDWLDLAIDDTSRTDTGVAALAACAASRASFSATRLASVWEELGSSDKALPRRLRECAASALLSKTLSTRSAAAGRVAAAVFRIVYRAVEHNRLAHDAWRLLDDVLPDVPIWDMWTVAHACAWG